MPSAEDTLRQQSGWQEWMIHWVIPKPVNAGYSTIQLYCCYNPDYQMFYASTDPAQAVAAFGREEFKYNG